MVFDSRSILIFALAGRNRLAAKLDNPELAPPAYSPAPNR